ncbi:MAG: serine protease Do [Pirellulaceae bacterium]|jgi:serine protease Do
MYDHFQNMNSDLPPMRSSNLEGLLPGEDSSSDLDRPSGHDSTGSQDASRSATGRPQKRETEVQRKSTSSAFAWILGFLLVLLALQFLIPRLVEQIQYSLTRGKQRAEYELAGEQLNNSPLTQMSTASQLISRRVAPSVVHINTSVRDYVETPVGGQPRPLSEADKGQGSGVIVDTRGYIVTNRHVVAGATAIDVKLGDGRVVTAEIVGEDTLTDLAVLKVDADGLLAAEWGDSDALNVGAMVWAIGSPFGLQHTVTFGILSGKNRGNVAGMPQQDFLQTDAAVNPGNSGGPLVDANGKIVGINTAIVGDAYQGISFSIPSKVARDVYDDILRVGHVSRGWLGVLLDDVDESIAAANNLDKPAGAFIKAIVADDNNISPAYSAGVRAGDVVLKWNETEINTAASLSLAVSRTHIGSTATILVARSGDLLSLQVAVTERPNRYSR